ncbi:MAG: alpha/beta fold hydrolase, partial [Nocardioides sp.]
GAGATTAQDLVDLDTTDCPADIADEVVSKVSCSYLTVPEDRSDPARTIEVMVGRITPPEVLHDDPMLVVGTDLASAPNYGGIAPLAERVGREVIIMDTRGVGRSRPDLACTELAPLRGTALTTATDDAATRVAYLDAVSECYDRLAGQGIDLASYNVSEMAADVEDLRVSLGVDEWNVITYGTASRIALEVVRGDSDHVRSLLMDSPELPGADPRRTSLHATREATRAVLATCAADARCAQAFPQVESSLDDAFAALEAEPVIVPMSSAGTSHDVYFDDALLARLLRATLSDGGSTGRLLLPESVPALLDLVNEGRLDQVGGSLAQAVAGSPPFCLGYQPKCEPQHRMSHGVTYSVLCHDVAPFHDAAEVSRQSAGPGVTPAYGSSHYLDVCDAWPVEQGTEDTVDQPMSTDVPTLVTVGGFATYSPEKVVREALSGFTDATVVVDPAGGHNVLARTDCMLEARGEFLNERALAAQDLDCLRDATVEWVLDPESMVVDEPPAAAASSALEGVWQATYTRQQIRAALDAGGYARLAEEFFATEQVSPRGVRLRTTFVDGEYSQAYWDGIWDVGWEGTYGIRGDRVAISADGAVDTLRWKVTRDRVVFEPVSSTIEVFKGIPEMAYLFAYFAAAPYDRVR